MAFLVTSALKDLRRRLADPAALLLWVGLPVVIGGFMSLISGANGPAPTARLLLVDRDNTLLSRLLASAGGQGPAGGLVQVEQVSAGEGNTRIQAGEASALLVIPKGFQDGILNETPTVLSLVTNPSQRILPGIIEEGLGMFAEAAFYLQRLLGAPIRKAVADSGATSGSPPSDDAVAAVSRVVNQSLTRLQGTLVPPIISVETKTEDKPADTRNFTAIFLPGLIFMGVLLMASGMSLDVWVEKERGTLRRALATPHRRAVFLAGKLVAAVTLMATVTVVVLLLSALVSIVPIRRVPLAAAWACYAGGVLFCYLALLQLLATTARGGGILSQLVVFPLMMIGGSFFPFEAMPAWMVAIGRWTPNGLAVVREQELLFGHPDPRAMVIALAALGAPAALAFLLGVRRLGRFAAS